MPHPQPLHITPQDGQTLSVVGDTYRLVLTGAQTGGAFAVIEMLVPQGGGPNPHSHAGFHESFHVLEGEIEVKSESGTLIAKTGDFIEIPTGGVVHSFKNKSPETARLWCVVVPAGMEEFFREIGKPVAFGEFLPVPEMDADEMKRLEAIAEKHGQKLFPPDYLG